MSPFLRSPVKAHGPIAKAEGFRNGAAPVEELLGSSGQPLDPVTRTSMESRFGHDFSQVRVHTDAKAAESAKALNASAYTANDHIVFGGGNHTPQTAEGLRLLTHELTHVVQQGTASHIADDGETSVYEDEARKIADVPPAGGVRCPVTQRASVPAIQRQETPGSPISPLSARYEGVIEMPWVGHGAPHSEQGYLRDAEYYWKKYMEKWSDHLSELNKSKIGNGESPIVDEKWIEFHPADAAYKGETLHHHHTGQGGRAVPLPETLHRAKSVLHPERQVVGKPTEAMRPLKPRPTATRTLQEIERHTRAGKIRGPGVEPERPPEAPVIPASSELMSLPPEELEPVSPRELEELARVDPRTGRVIESAGAAQPEIVSPTGIPKPGFQVRYPRIAAMLRVSGRMAGGVARVLLGEEMFFLSMMLMPIDTLREIVEARRTPLRFLSNKAIAYAYTSWVFRGRDGILWEPPNADLEKIRSWILGEGGLDEAKKAWRETTDETLKDLVWFHAAELKWSSQRYKKHLKKVFGEDEKSFAQALYEQLVKHFSGALQEMHRELTCDYPD